MSIWSRRSNVSRLCCAWLLPIWTVLSPALAMACPNCPPAREARSQVWDQAFGFNLAVALFPFLVMGAVSLRVDAGARGSTSPGAGDRGRGATHSGALIAAGLLLGTGLGGFLDGIVLHQVLQWHNMLSSWRPPTDLVTMKYNMLWDGLFHLFTWLMTALGLWRLWCAAKRPDVAWSAPVLMGGLLIGWGTFNFVEGLIDHQLLGIHHVHPGQDQLAWDLGFLAFGLALIAGGWASIKAGQRQTSSH